MTTQTATLADFLLQRIADDEAAANDASGRAWESWNRSWDIGGARDIAARTLGEPNGGERIFQVPVPLDEHVARHDPARVLAECAAKRALLDDAETLAAIPGDSSRGEALRAQGNRMLSLLAATYADHPDYREEWRA